LVPGEEDDETLGGGIVDEAADRAEIIVIEAIVVEAVGPPRLYGGPGDAEADGVDAETGEKAELGAGAGEGRVVGVDEGRIGHELVADVDAAIDADAPRVIAEQARV
jgi:hypothetical protein